MKLLQINSTANWGSTGRIAEEIGQLALREGWESYIAYGRYRTESKSVTLKIGTKWDIYNHVIQTRLFDKHGLASIDATKDLINKIMTIKPDIIHLHNIHGYYLNYEVLFNYLSQSKIPVVWTLHDCWAFTGHCSHFSYIDCNLWQTQCHNCPQKNEYPTSWIYDRSELNFLTKKSAFGIIKNLNLVPVSNWLANEIRKSFFKDCPVNIIHNGINTEIFKPHSIKKEDLGLDNKFVVLGVANIWSPRKGLSDFLYLREKLSEDYLIVLIGLDKRQIKKLPKGIIGIERTNNVLELVQYYSVADVYLNTSVEESLGLTSVEAMACGTPAIVYESTACSEVLNTNTGLVVKPHDIGHIVGILIKIKDGELNFNPLLCREHVLQNFNETQQYAKYLDLYNSILNNTI